MACVFGNPVDCVSDAFGGAARSVADSAFSAIAHDFAQTTDSMVNWLWRQISSATTVSLGGKGFSADLAITASIAATVGLGLFLIQIVLSVLRREPGGLARAGRGLLVAFVAGAASIAVVNLLLHAVDDLSAGVVRVATGATINQMGNRILDAGAISTVSNPAAVILLSLVVAGATVVVWAALMVRKLLIIVAAVFAPIAFAGSLADITTGWVRRWIEAMVALIVSKLILVIILTVGLGVLVDGVGESQQTGAGRVTQSMTQTVTGALILVMAGFAPWLAIKLVHFAGDSFHTIHAHAGAVRAGAATVTSSPQRVKAMASKLPMPSRPAHIAEQPHAPGAGTNKTPGSGVTGTPPVSAPAAHPSRGAAPVGAGMAAAASGATLKRSMDAVSRAEHLYPSAAPPVDHPQTAQPRSPVVAGSVRPVQVVDERRP